MSNSGHVGNKLFLDLAIEHRTSNKIHKYRDKNRGSLFIKYRRSIIAGKKAPAGAHPGAQGLESPRFMYSRHKNEDSLFIKYRRCIFAGKKAPAGAHPGAQSLESPCFLC